ncbi:hypothetical protein GGR27_000436 [Lewinella antarctica]|uniref:Uncharacterized protein n=1 Tax=Neolewinella antarctica TaxID=442734 RepID=A0ABX0X6W2_9BACT|nr:hypothetical protein [Neolewinella antarctica]
MELAFLCFCVCVANNFNRNLDKSIPRSYLSAMQNKRSSISLWWRAQLNS